MGLKDFFIKREITADAQAGREGKLGKSIQTVWQYLDGWKTFIVAAILVAQQLFPGFPGFHYVTLALQAIGWADVKPAVDPGQVATFIAAAVALGHKLVKAYQQLKAGTPVKDLHP